MLILRRAEGQWVTITHVESGQAIKVKVLAIRESEEHPAADLGFDDQPHHFDVQRPERFRMRREDHAAGPGELREVKELGGHVPAVVPPARQLGPG